MHASTSPGRGHPLSEHPRGRLLLLGFIVCCLILWTALGTAQAAEREGMPKSPRHGVGFKPGEGCGTR
jgi:hypothetical protein